MNGLSNNSNFTIFIDGQILLREQFPFDAGIFTSNFIKNTARILCIQQIQREREKSLVRC